MTGMKGTLKLNSVAEEEKSKLVPDEEAEAPPPLAFLSAMAADPRPLRGSASPVPHTDRKPVTEGATALPHLRTGGTARTAAQVPVFFRKLTPPKINKVKSASDPSLSRDTLWPRETRPVCWNVAAADFESKR